MSYEEHKTILNLKDRQPYNHDIPEPATSLRRLWLLETLCYGSLRGGREGLSERAVSGNATKRRHINTRSRAKASRIEIMQETLNGLVVVTVCVEPHVKIRPRSH